MRARDAQTFQICLQELFNLRLVKVLSVRNTANLHRRAILEEAAGISGLHVRRHEAELRLSAAENNLKRADELRRQHKNNLLTFKSKLKKLPNTKISQKKLKELKQDYII